MQRISPVLRRLDAGICFGGVYSASWPVALQVSPFSEGGLLERNDQTHTGHLNRLALFRRPVAGSGRKGETGDIRE